MDVPAFNATSLSRREEASPRHWLGSESTAMAGEDLPARAWAGSDHEGHDRMLDALACGDEPFDPDEPVPMRRASRTVLQSLAAHNPAARTGTPGLEPLGVPAPDRARVASSSGGTGSGAPSSSTSGVRSGPDAA